MLSGLRFVCRHVFAFVAIEVGRTAGGDGDFVCVCVCVCVCVWRIEMKKNKTPQIGSTKPRV